MIRVRCPVCQREMTGERGAWPQWPFCSPRCRTIDLGRWLGEHYRVAGSTDASDEEDFDEAPMVPPLGQSSGRSP